QSGLVGGAYAVPPEYSHSRGGQRMVQVGLISQPPAAAQVGRAYVLFVPRDAAGDDDFTLFFSQEDLFNARMDELTPAASGVLQVRAKMFAERVVNELLAELKDKAEQALRHAR